MPAKRTESPTKTPGVYLSAERHAQVLNQIVISGLPMRDIAEAIGMEVSHFTHAMHSRRPWPADFEARWERNVAPLIAEAADRLQGRADLLKTSMAGVAA